MSKSTLPIFIKGGGFTIDHHVEVPCRLPEALTLMVKTERAGALKATAYLNGLEISAGEFHESDKHDLSDADADRLIVATHNILCVIKATLGITGPVPPGSPLPAIALAYEAEVVAYEARRNAFRALPPYIRSLDFAPNHPEAEGPTGYMSPAIRMLAKYVEYVVEQAAKVTL